MKTAVEWLYEHILLTPLDIRSINKCLEQAKEIEKLQIGKAFLNGRIKEIGSGVLFDLQPLTETFDNYYNETFKSE
jgi:hypothetical protein